MPRSRTALLVLVISTPASAQPPIGLDAMASLDALSQLRQGVRMYQASSYDRTGGNEDRGNFLRNLAGNERVGLDVQGPGCIYRIWFTGDPGGRIKIYLDGSNVAAIDMTRATFFSGAQSPFLTPLVGNNFASSGGYYCYLPIPFRTGCRVTFVGGEEYYNITYARFADAEGVTTFTGLEDQTAVRAMWNNTGTDPKTDTGTTTATDTIAISAGGMATLADIPSAGTIQQLELTFPGLSPGSASRTLLTSLRLKAYWDNNAMPAIDAPVADFFGSGLGAGTIRGLLLGMEGPRLYCYFPMPFGSRALLELHNNSGSPVANIGVKIKFTPSPGAMPGIGQFYAKFRSETPTTDGVDYLILNETGAGHLVGVTQTLTGYTQFRWHLEGDERIHVDGSRTPQLHGTGLEDFYNGGWYFQEGPFSLPVHGAPHHNDQLPWLTAVYRLLLSDMIPFTNAIHVGIEHGFYNNISADFRSVAYYYKRSAPLSELSDELDVGNLASESAHGYSETSTTFLGQTSGKYEGDIDTTINDIGRRIHDGGGSTFTLQLSTAVNAGALLRRRMDYSREHQRAEVRVDNVPAGYWYEPGSNNTRIWRDSEFMIPPSMTRGKTSIQIRLTNAAGGGEWTEYRYWLYTMLPASPRVSVSPTHLAVQTVADVNPPAGELTITNGGLNDLNYSITDNVSWLSVTPASGAISVTPEDVQVTYNVTALPAGDHSATITVTDTDNPDPTASVAVLSTLIAKPGAFDGDGDVDQTDFGTFQACLSGPGVAQWLPQCAAALLDSDGDVDGDDFGRFQACISGANTPSDPQCTQ